MRRIICLILMVLQNVTGSIAYADFNNPSSDHKPPYEKGFFDAGYTPIEVAIKECEKHFNRNIDLPIKLPPVVFTHVLGKCYNQGDRNDINAHFEIRYLNENQGKNHYLITLRPIEHKIQRYPHPRKIIKTYKLKNGTVANYAKFNDHINIFVFENKQWQYTLWVDKRIEDQVTAGVLVEIADSIGNKGK